jgi:hypothetical protein
MREPDEPRDKSKPREFWAWVDEIGVYRTSWQKPGPEYKPFLVREVMQDE